MKQLDPKATWLFFLRSAGPFIVFAVFFTVFATVSLEIVSRVPVVGIGFSPGALGARIVLLVIFIFLVLAYLWAWLTCHFYRYELSDQGFKKELGVIFKKYVTIPYDRIQNVDINRGLLARMLGLSEVYIQTAGISGVSSAEGKLPGLSKQEAELLRDKLIDRAVGASSDRQGL